MPKSQLASIHRRAPRLIALCRAIRSAGGSAWLVGGWVRDTLAGGDSSDYDIEVFGLRADQLQRIAARFGRVLPVGRCFPVLKLEGADLRADLALPRREASTGPGHRDFAVAADPKMSPEEAAQRRDFTINAMMYDPIEDRLFDPFGGRADLRAGILRHVGPAFVEDPLRPLRAMQLAARLDLRLAPESADLCRTMVAESAALPEARIAGEWRKWATADHPEAGLRALRESGWIAAWPELARLPATPQEPRWHPEGDVWNHTVLCCAAAAAIARRDRLDAEARTVLLFAALCHDLGKPATTARGEDGLLHAHDHARAGLAPTGSLLTAIGAPRGVIERVVPLVREHLVHLHGDPTPRAVRRLADRLRPASLRDWERLIEADASGRAPHPPGRPALAWLRLAEALAVQRQPPKPIVTGKWLLAHGMTPGPEVGRLLRAAWQLQLDGVITDAASAETWWRTTQNGDPVAGNR
ncbi:MAG: HD domain-containing protein [Zetaproteobacteria bacterium]|nr:MAG: HD domain-containing protein [Zetaproteobacteria bacterium]